MNANFSVLNLTFGGLLHPKRKLVIHDFIDERNRRRKYYFDDEGFIFQG